MENGCTYIACEADLWKKNSTKLLTVCGNEILDGYCCKLSK